MNEIFERLVQFGNETDRNLFCQRLQIIWHEQGIVCSTYPTITNQILDLYKLHHLVQEKQGYLEVTTNRGWKEISNVLGFGDSGSAAYSVKRNYVRLGLLAYECQFDRAGIDPRSVIELSEMPHTTKKRKRTSQNFLPKMKQSTPTTSNEFDEIKSSSPIESCQPIARFNPQPISIQDLHNLNFILRAGYLADSNRYLDAILIHLTDARTSSYFNLKFLPGLLHALVEQYTACLYEIFEQSFLPNSSTNDFYLNWFLESKFRINDIAIGPNLSHRSYAIIERCLCLSTIIRNLSFIDENHSLANVRCLNEIFERILNCQHDFYHEIFDSNHCSQLKISENEDNRNVLIYLLDSTFITLSNLSIFIEFQHWSSLIRTRFVRTLTHWIICSLSLATDSFISMLMEDKQKEIFISPRQISLQILAKICTNEINVDFILFDFNIDELQIFIDHLLSLMNTIYHEDINREYCLSIIYLLCKRSRQLVEYLASKMLIIELIFNYLEFYEYHQQQYLIATLTSCYNSTLTTMPINHSNDMMIDTCIQLLYLFASIQSTNCLKSSEMKLVDMSASIYFEQRILKDFAEILFLLKF